MRLIIDAYNVLKAVMGGVSITETERERFVKRLTAYAHIKGHQIVLVFDGGSYDRPEVVQQPHMRVVYVGHRLSADDYIKSMLNERYAAEQLLVSSDRALCNYARRHEIISIEAAFFYQLMMRVIERPAQSAQRAISGPVRKRVGHESSPELDMLMEGLAGVPVKEGSDTKVPTREETPYAVGSRQRSKKEKKLLHLVKKL